MHIPAVNRVGQNVNPQMPYKHMRTNIFRIPLFMSSSWWKELLIIFFFNPYYSTFERILRIYLNTPINLIDWLTDWLSLFTQLRPGKVGSGWITKHKYVPPVILDSLIVHITYLDSFAALLLSILLLLTKCPARCLIRGYHYVLWCKP